MMGFLPDGAFDWRYRTVPQVHCNMRRFPWPRGRTLGGSSSINYMIYIRGHAADYDHWAELGNKGWSYREVLPVFKKSEHNERMEDQFHGRGGPLNVADHRFRHPLSEMFVDAGQVWERGEEFVTISGMRVTPGAGVRFTTPLGPVRVDAAYNGYAAERGPLLYQASDTSRTITQIRPSYPPVRVNKTFWQKIIIQFAVGQAF